VIPLHEKYPVPGRDIWPFVCEKCNIEFAYKEDFNMHKKLHKGQRTLSESLNSDKKIIPREYIKYGFPPDRSAGENPDLR